jgi:hypothetical protein
LLGYFFLELHRPFEFLLRFEESEIQAVRPVDYPSIFVACLRHFNAYSMEFGFVDSVDM